MSAAGKVRTRDEHGKNRDAMHFEAAKLNLIHGFIDEGMCLAAGIKNTALREAIVRNADRLSHPGYTTQEDWEEKMKAMKLGAIPDKCLDDTIHLRETDLLKCITKNARREDAGYGIYLSTTLDGWIKELEVLVRKFNIRNSAVKILRQAHEYHLARLHEREASEKTKK
jgi:hypothetical protein